MKIYRTNRLALLIKKIGGRKDNSAEVATNTIRIFLSSPACTAAVPMTIPPTIPIVCPTLAGIREPASRNTSTISSINNTSMRGGKGTLLLDS